MEQRDLFFERSLDLMCVASTDGYFRDLNPAWERTLGYPLEVLVSRPFLDFVHEDDRESTVREMAALLEGQTTKHFVNRYRRATGGYAWLAWTCYPDLDQGLLFAVARDITEERRKEAALVESEGRFRQLADDAPVMIWMAGPDGECTYVNARWIDFTGRPLEEQTGDGWIKCIPSDEAERVFDRLMRSVAARDPFHAEFRVRRADGELRWVLDQGVPRFDGNGEFVGYIGSCVDITDQKNVELGLRREQSELARAIERERREQEIERHLQQTQRLESLGVLAGGIAHDFNNLLTGVLGNAEILRPMLPPGFDGHDYLDNLERATKHAAELCRQMLAYAGEGNVVIERVDLARLVKDMGNLLEVSVSKTANFDVAVSPTPDIAADKSQLRQVVMNLVMNASDALPDGEGRITLSLRAREVEETELAGCLLGAKRKPGFYVALEVTDTGSGIDEATQRRIFDPFYTTKFTGRGLGLAAVLGIVRRHEGAIRLRSAVGEGTTISVLFPPASTAADHTDEPPQAGDWRGSGTVLVVDDEPDVRDVARVLLEQLGFDVVTAENGRVALDLIAEAATGVDLVLLDLTMPVLDGRATFLEIQRLHPDIPVILFSGYGEENSAGRFTGLGLSGFVQKPYSRGELITVLREALEGGRRPPAAPPPSAGPHSTG